MSVDLSGFANLTGLFPSGIAQNYQDTGAELVEAPPFDKLRARSTDTYALYSFPTRFLETKH